jgi:hypothetical protein
MMKNAGELRDQIDVLELAELSNGAYGWVPVIRLWAKAEHQTGNNIFSKTGVSAKSIRFTIREWPRLTLHNALFFVSGKGEHCVLTDIDDKSEPGHYILTAALIEPVACKAERTTTSKGALNRPEVKQQDPVTFPGYLTEKWLRQAQEEPMSYSEIRYVLVTPKVIDISIGVLVEIGGKRYEAVIPHTLDPHKNEYELQWRGDN